MFNGDTIIVLYFKNVPKLLRKSENASTLTYDSNTVFILHFSPFILNCVLFLKFMKVNMVTGSHCNNYFYNDLSVLFSILQSCKTKN